MALNYDDEIVIWTYYYARNDDKDPSTDEITGWDKTLFATYELVLNSEMPQHGIALTRRNKSRIVLLAQGSNGKRPVTRVRNACEYFVNAAKLDTDIVPFV